MKGSLLLLLLVVVAASADHLLLDHVLFSEELGFQYTHIIHVLWGRERVSVMQCLVGSQSALE